MIAVVEGVRFRRLLPEIYNLFPILDMVFENRGVDCVITSANDRTHMQGSLHYQDRALDLRSHDLPAGQEQAVVAELQQALGLDYTVLLEDLNTPNEHFHVGFRPKEVAHDESP